MEQEKRISSNRFWLGGSMVSNATVAIVDDDQSVREAMGSLIESLGYRASVFSSAEQFLASDTLGETQCLISDMQMPGIGGENLFWKMRTERPSLPVILISAYADEKTGRRLITSGAAGFFFKPFDIKGLISCLDLLLSDNTVL